ncbi:MAG: ATP-grasp domain-containing protein [Gammaproteobacteria bacterium]|nr:ATP-grasp domain-containing protein [Gammaproteobacteria bacterium]
MDIPAVVLSGNLGEDANNRSMNEIALALTRSLGRHGVPVYRFHPNRSVMDLSSRYCVHVPCPNLYEDPASLVDALVEFADAKSQRPVLFPSSDGAAQFIADNEEALSAHFALTTPSATCIGNTQNKRRLIEIAEAAGIPVPETHFPTNPDELPNIADSVSYPVIIKPLYSPDWKRPEVTRVFGRVKALEVAEPEQLIDSCKALLSLSSEFMVQEIVPGPTENLLTFLGYIDSDGNTLTGCVRKKLRQYPPGFGYCAATESVDDAEVVDLATELFKTLNYRGIGCAEFKRDARSGKTRLIEINTRAVRTSALAIAAGADFPWVAYQDAVSPGSVKPALDYRVPVLWIHLRDEFRSAGLMMLKGQLSPVKWVRGFFGKPVVVAEFSWDDMRPGLLFWAHMPWRLVKVLFGRLRRSSRQGASRPAA